MLLILYVILEYLSLFARCVMQKEFEWNAETNIISDICLFETKFMKNKTWEHIYSIKTSFYWFKCFQ